MSDEQKSMVENLIDDLKHQRDELRLKLHLGGQELRDEWEKLDDRFAELSRRYQPVKEAVEESADDVWEALQLLGSEIKEGFARIRKSL